MKVIDYSEYRILKNKQNQCSLLRGGRGKLETIFEVRSIQWYIRFKNFLQTLLRALATRLIPS